MHYYNGHPTIPQKIPATFDINFKIPPPQKKQKKRVPFLQRPTIATIRKKKKKQSNIIAVNQPLVGGFKPFEKY